LSSTPAKPNGTWGSEQPGRQRRRLRSCPIDTREPNRSLDNGFTLHVAARNRTCGSSGQNRSSRPFPSPRTAWLPGGWETPKLRPGGWAVNSSSNGHAAPSLAANLRPCRSYKLSPNAFCSVRVRPMPTPACSRR
jgi:hypothetical protein